MKYVLLISSVMLATMSTSHAFSVNEHNDVRQLGSLLEQDLGKNNIGIVEAFSLIPNLTEFEFNAVDLNNDKRLNRSELHILSLYNS